MRSSRSTGLYPVFKRGEAYRICQAALAEAPEGLDTRELALVVIRAKSMDESDTVLRKAIGFRIVQAMRMQEKRGCIAGAGKRKGVRGGAGFIHRPQSTGC